MVFSATCKRFKFPLAIGLAGLLAASSLSRTARAAEIVPVDLSDYHPECGVTITTEEQAKTGRLKVEWPVAAGETGQLLLDTRPGRPLLASIGIVVDDEKPALATLLKDVDPVTFVTVGSRMSPPDRPPGMSLFNVFFDNPAKRPFQSYRAQLDLKRIRVVSQGQRASVILGNVAAGPFTGELHLTVYRGSRLVNVESVLSTKEADRAYLYDAGLASETPSWSQFAWMDTEGKLARHNLDKQANDQAVAVRHRAIIAESELGSVACFPPPHRFFTPRDFTDNLQNVWQGRNHRGLDERPGFGIRQAETGGGNYVPWFNAPPGTEQHMGVFYLLSLKKADEALRETLRYTHGDRFPEIPGHTTFTSHYHMAITMAAMKEAAQGGVRTTPDFVRMFKDMNVNFVHLGEFHGDGHQKDPGPLRLPELDAMFAECRRLSDAELLILPGEEVDTFLGISGPGQHSGHWMSFFPKPVYWTMKRASGEPFAEEDPRRGTVYRVGSREDMTRLLEREHGLVWTAHPRIKASNWAPDAFRNEDYFRADTWLGAAWKAMPADLANPRLGQRALDLLDDMANWGGKKQMIGEVDVFKLDHTHELYGHMNINYLRLDHIPRFEEGWQPVLDAIRGGRFFVTTGEVLLRDFSVGGKASGETLDLNISSKPETQITLEWTFPLEFAELVSGDGTKVVRQRIDLTDTEPFGRRTLTLQPELKGHQWIRVEAWDIAGNGAFSSPVWLEESKP
ncbi:CehA/McbA family metallohydrolase domain-containing protein [Singulisphaera acidiphila]|uniref:Uncharacterized protein n=1 Tax=Singulisphaera acidiphila (strain ATCC BAA-1392 / DSM 18658 / VKM B-2454 / MOB10) TaxID=886293 RepID=L0DCZ2_SINAD|nr:hypothetical protein [Singulisphaera acidiphila]AGA27112.1 hypothetical protein Sinac_2820 [Singulisphaera acidiphila DSM 18658]